MSTKTIAVDARIYARLAAAKRESESFTRAIARLLDVAESAHTGADILSGLAKTTPLAASEASALLGAVAENRRTEKWGRHDLR